MKIVVTGLRGIPEVMGGVETHCQELLPRLKRWRPDFDITVIARRPYSQPRPYAYQGLAVVPLFSPRQVSLEAIVSTLLGVLYARWHGARLVHIHAIGPALLAPLAWALGARVAVTHHGHDYNRAKWGRVARTMLRLGEAAAVRFADRVIAVSPSLARTLKADHPAHAGKVVYIPNGAPALVASDAGGDDPLARFGLARGGYILAVGRLVPEKGLHDLLDAFDPAHDARRLVIVGGADHASPYSRALIERGGERIVFTGLQSRATLKTLYENADLFVMPSTHEGLPIAALEAASCGAPMLLSDIAPNRDIGLEARNYFPVGDVAALRSRLAEPAARFAIDAAAVRRRFDWDAVTRATADVYAELDRA